MGTGENVEGHGCQKAVRSGHCRQAGSPRLTANQVHAENCDSTPVCPHKLSLP